MIRIEVTGDNAAEVLAQLRGLAGVVSQNVGDGVVSIPHNIPADGKLPLVGSTAEEAAAPADAKPKRKNVSKEQADAAREGKSASEDTQPAGGKPEASTAGTDTSGETTSTSSTATSDASPSELNFDTDVAPVVLRVVQSKGKPAVEAVLEEFGVARASQLESSRWQELIDKLEEVG